MYAIEWDLSDFAAKAESFERVFINNGHLELELLGKQIADSIVSGQYFQNQSNAMKRGTKYGATGILQGQVTSKPKHALFLDKGTKPHEIRAKRAKVLAFFWPKVGSMVFTRRVSHPGTKPRFTSMVETAFAREHLPAYVDRAAEASVAQAGLS